MKSWISKATLAIAIAVALPVLAHADTWKIDPMHTNVEFSVRHMMISNVKGQFQKTYGNDHHQRRRPDLGENRRDHRRLVDRHPGREARRRSEESRLSRRREVPHHHLQIDQG